MRWFAFHIVLILNSRAGWVFNFGVATNISKVVSF